MIAERNKLKGFFRVNITEDVNGKQKIVGDSGWKENQVTNLGIQDYLVDAILGNAGNKAVTHCALGTGTAPGATATTLDGENFHRSTNGTTNSRATATTSIVASKTAQFTAAFLSINSVVTAAVNISNVGLFETTLTSLATAGTLFAGNNYTSSSLATNQNVNVTYQIRFT